MLVGTWKGAFGSLKGDRWLKRTYSFGGKRNRGFVQGQEATFSYRGPKTDLISPRLSRDLIL